MFKNSLYLPILFILLFFNACKARQSSSNNIETIKFDETDISNTNTVQEEIADSNEIAEIPNVEIDSSLIETELKLKPIYKIALVLPFMEDSVRSAWKDAKESNFDEYKSSKESEISASFLEGMITAVKGNNFKSKFEIKVFDNQDTDFGTKEVLNQLTKEEFDVIIGPYAKDHLNEIAKYAADNKIIHLSPFSPSKSASYVNSNYFMLEPSLDQHLLSMLDFTVDSIENCSIKFFYNNNAFGKGYAQLVSAYLDTINKNKDLEAKINYTLIQIGDEIAISKYLDADKENVIIVNSFSEDYLHKFLRALGQLDKKETFTVFGMPGWENSQILRLEHLNEHEIHFTTSFWLDKEKTELIDFEAKYKAKYLKLPNEYALLGADMVNIFFKLIDQKGLSLTNSCLGEDFEGLAKNYKMKAISNSDKKIVRLENSALRVYKILNYEPYLLR